MLDQLRHSPAKIDAQNNVQNLRWVFEKLISTPLQHTEFDRCGRFHLDHAEPPTFDYDRARRRSSSQCG
jgi:hypothetical protein